jgi:hypothetical protein
MNNYDYPAGADTAAAPWNQGETTDMVCGDCGHTIDWDGIMPNGAPCPVTYDDGEPCEGTMEDADLSDGGYDDGPGDW